MADNELGALWKKVSKTGVEFYSGVLKIDDKAIEVVVFKNEKKHDRQPDFRILRSTPRQDAPVEASEEEGEGIPF